MRLSRETPTTRFDTFTGRVDHPEFLTIIFEIMRPPPKAGRYFQNRPGWQAISNTRKDGAGPLRGGTAPGLGPLLTCIFPIVLRCLARHTSLVKTWLGPESNRRHVDFQSTALPTELPSLCKRPWPAASMSGLLTKAEIALRSTHNAEFKTCAAIPRLYAADAGNGLVKFRCRQIAAGAE